MTSHVSISGNIAGPGSSQINNVNNSYGMQEFTCLDLWMSDLKFNHNA